MRIFCTHFFLLFLCLIVFTNQGFTQNAAPVTGQLPHKTCGLKPMMDLYPDLAKEAADYIEKTIPQLEATGASNQTEEVAPILTIPVVVHVIHSGEAVGTGSNLSDAQIQAQIEILNQDFFATNPNFNETPAQWTSAIGNPEIQFCLASVDENGFPTTGITRNNIAVTGTTIGGSNIDSQIKPATYWDPTEYYNIWTLSIPGTTASGGVVGFAFLPTTGIIGDNRDGTVVDFNWFGGPGFGQTGYKTLTHETGHYLGLPHTFDGDNCGADDNISDTPNIDQATSSAIPNLNCSSGNFPTGPTSCSNEHMYVNYMDYVNSDYCYTSFTQGQITVMRSILNGNSGIPGYGSRQSVMNNSVTVCSFLDDDAGISQVITPEPGLTCDTSEVTPEVSLSNFGANTLSTVKIKYQINNDAPVEFIWIDNLLTGESVNVTLASYTPPNGSYTFKVYTEAPNGVTDQQPANDTISLQAAAVLPIDLPLNETFETTDFDPTNNGLFIYNPDNDGFAWEHNQSISAYGNGSGSAVFNNYDGVNGNNPFGTFDAMITPIYDFTTVTNATLKFDVAYARYISGSNVLSDSLLVLVSTDCGTTYNQTIFFDGGATLETGTGSPAIFVPGPTEWKTIEIDLSNFANTPNLSISFINLSGWGNQLFLDNIQVSQTNVVDCSTLAISMTSTDVTCNGASNGTATVTSSGGNGNYTYQWSNTFTSATISNLSTGTYIVTITDGNNCSVIDQIAISEPAALTVNVENTEETSPGAGDGTATAETNGGTPGYAYLWSHGGTTATVIGLVAGEYFVTITDNNDCIEIGQITINTTTNCSNFSVQNSAINVSCNGMTNGTAVGIAVGGTSPYNYLWNDGATGSVNSNITAGIYSVTVSDGNNCTTIGLVTVNEPALLEVNVVATDETIVGLNNGTATAIVSGGTEDYSYIWSNNATEFAIANLAPGTYIVTVSDANGCIQIDQTIVGAGSIDCSTLSINSQQTNVSCFGGIDGTAGISVEAGTAPYNYLWSNGNTSANPTNLTAGSYQLTVTDANGCEAFSNVSITQPAALSTSLTINHETIAGLGDGNIMVTAIGGTPNYSYLWSNGSMGQNINSVAPGTYTVTITDVMNCSIIENATVNSGVVDCSTLQGSLVTTNATCNGVNNGSIEVMINGGTAPYNYLWSNGTTDVSNTNLSPGIYSVVMTDANGCEFEGSTSITEPDPILVSLSTEVGNCGQSGTVTANPNGGLSPYFYQWSDGQTNQTISVNLSGIYVVTVSDILGCSMVDEIAVTVHPANLSALSTNMDISCSGASDGGIELSITGGMAPYIFEWNNGATSQNLSDLSAGEYSVLVTDALGCTFLKMITLNDPVQLGISCEATPATNGNNGTASANGSGGTLPYSYVWSHGAFGASINNLASGLYVVTVTDGHGCQEECIIDIIATSATTIQSLNLLEIYPNPAINLLNINAEFDQVESIDMEIWNAIGQRIYFTTVVDRRLSLRLDVSGFAAGTYFLKIRTAEGQVTEKILISQ